MKKKLEEANRLYSLVTQRPDLTLSKSVIICPFKCRKSTIRVHSIVNSCVGGYPDPNHYWVTCKCEKCNKDFIQEYKTDNVWYTAENKVLKGMPSCFENYIYTCAYCSGEVHRKYTELDGVTPTNSLGSKINEEGVWERDYREFYCCQKCPATIEKE